MVHPTKPLKPHAIAIGSSTGGPEALIRLLGQMTGKFDHVPIFITQHMPLKHTGFLALKIGQISGYPCTEAIDGEKVVGGHIYLAPGDFHMLVENSRTGPVIKLSQAEAENFCRPAVDPMVRSIAELYGNKTLFIILTGMGKDGLSGAARVAEKNGIIIAQDEETSVVWGMPGAVAKAGLCSQILPLDEIKNYLCLILS